MSNDSIRTDRLILRPYASMDVADLVKFAGAREVAATTLRIPHPYTEDDARSFIATCQHEAQRGPITRFAITRTEDGQFCGGIGLRMEDDHRRAELGYWLGVPFWGNGYASEAARAMIDYGFDKLHLNRIYASYVTHNVASGRILQKIGMRYEGCLRNHIRKWDKYYDLECYGMLKTDPRP
jgi:[ribosomal protein S5]-alanine N-acetyltransferase